ncbi:hypothetical protein MAR_010800 [Mya arenaria]|uniref:Uncharacterized protein n=1 Tax=Mya arenaria TaxID=6604 RepID=A0ABY7FW79_MYAAR|nr:hypothetical protein MAR_010800 [Mya arenaria]
MTTQCEKEFNLKHFGLGHKKPIVFVTSTFGPKWFYPMWLAVQLIYHMIVLGIDGNAVSGQDGEPSFRYFLYIHNWAYMLIVLSNVIDLGVTVYVHVLARYILEERESNKGGAQIVMRNKVAKISFKTMGEYYQVRWYLKLTWVLFTMSTVLGMAVSLLYWILFLVRTSLSLAAHTTTTTQRPCQARDDCKYLTCDGNNGQDHTCTDGVCQCMHVRRYARAGEACKVDVDCNSTVCHHGAPHCEIHDPNAEHGHCNCHAAKRAGEACKVDVDCNSTVCHHGAPHCEIHDPNAEHGHCNCHVAKRAGEACKVDVDCNSTVCHHERAGEACKVDVDCNSTVCHHGAPHCEIHDPNAEHGHCNCHVAKRAGEACTSDLDCAGNTCNHGSPHCEIHDPALAHGHCNCHTV